MMPHHLLKNGNDMLHVNVLRSQICKFCCGCKISYALHACMLIFGQLIIFFLSPWLLQNAGSEEAKNIIHVCVHDKATRTAFHVCAAQVNHLECVESFMEFSFIRLEKKVSHGILQKL